MDSKNLIIDYLQKNPNSSSKEIFEGIGRQKSLATVKRLLSKLIQEHLVVSTGKGRSIRYNLSPVYKLFEPIDYKKAILLFYEQNNIASFKKILVSKLNLLLKPIYSWLK